MDLEPRPTYIVEHDDDAHHTAIMMAALYVHLCVVGRLTRILYNQSSVWFEFGLFHLSTQAAQAARKPPVDRVVCVESSLI